jgi:hypothetical protein
VAFNNAQNSLKSGARCNELSPEELDGGDPFGGRTREPVSERRIACRFVVEARDGERPSIQFELHGLIV